MATVIATLASLLWATPALAIVDPDEVAFGSANLSYYKVFENVLETGDMLLVAEGFVSYNTTPTDYTASQAFLFQLRSVGGSSIIAQTTLKSYGDRPISIYLSYSRVTTLGLVSGTAYQLRITSNPMVLTPSANNTASVTLSSGDYVDQELGDDGGVATNNLMRNSLLIMAENIEDYDSPSSPYIITMGGTRYLTIDGANIFLVGIPNLVYMCPILFQAAQERMVSEPPETTGAYALTLTPAQKWGKTVADGLTNLGLYLGMNQALAGSVVLFALAIAFSVFVYNRTQSGISVLLLVAATPFVGSYLGLVPMAIAILMVIFIVVLMGFFFFSRGAL